MYEDGNKHLSFDWKSLLIKLVILVAIVLLACWIFNSATKGKSTSQNTLTNDNKEYIANITAMKSAAFEHYTSSKLPEKVGGTDRLTLAQMLNQKLLIDFTDDGKECDINSSYIQVTKTADNNYALKVSLTCDNKSDFIVTSIEDQVNCKNNGTCTIIDNSSNNNNSTDKNNNSSTNNNSSSTNKPSSSSKPSSNKPASSKPTTNTSTKTDTKVTTTTVTTSVTVKVDCTDCNSSTPTKPEEQPKPTNQKTRYYELIQYSPWKLGRPYGTNVERDYGRIPTIDYCKYETKTYYTTSYVTNQRANYSQYNYQLELKDIDPQEVAYIKLADRGKHFGSSITDYRNYLKYRDENLYQTGNTGAADSIIRDEDLFKDSSLKDKNFDFDLSPITYSSAANRYVTNVKVNYFHSSGVKSYYDRYLNKSLYYVPIKFKVDIAYKDDCIRDTEDNWEKYSSDYIEVNRQVEETYYYRTYEKTWSTSKNVSGWEYTGNYEDR